MVLRDRMDDRVLNGSEILEFVDENCVPSRLNLGANLVETEYISGTHDEHVEIDEVPLLQELDVVDIEIVIALIHPEVVDESMRGKSRQCVPGPFGCDTN